MQAFGARAALPRGEIAVGDEVSIRATGELVHVVAILDAAGTALVRSGADEFQAARDELAWPWEKHASCACCG